MSATCQRQSGLTLLESLIGLTIIMILAGVAIWPFRALRDEQLLKGAVEDVLSVLNNARAQTLAGSAQSQYGVHFENDTITLFRGDMYPGVTEQIITLPPRVVFGAISLAGGGAEVVFQRLTGATTQTGSVVVELASDATKRRVVEIYSSGLINETP